MRLHWFVTFRSVFYAFLLHAVAIALLFISLDFTPAPIRPAPKVNIVNAVSVDKTQVEAELERLKKADQDKLETEKKRVAELEAKAREEQKKAEQAKKQRQEEEEKLLAAKKKKEQEQKQREQEEQKLALLEKEKQELERQRKIEEEKKLKTEEERRKKEEELKRLAEEKIRQEEERKRKEDEQKLKEEMDRELAAEEARFREESDQRTITKLGNEINEKITKYFNLTGLPENLSCKLNVKLLPSGEVVSASISQSSGNDIFDRRALTAVQKASPLPVPEDINIFERLNLRDATFTFKP